jgi:uncharacterized membrane protein
MLMGCMTAIIAAPFRLIGYIWNRFGGIGIIVLLVLIAIIVVIVLIINGNQQRRAEILQASIPSVTSAPYLIQTTSRYYFALEVKETTDGYYLPVYWEQVGGRWLKRTDLHLKRALFGEIPVKKR